MTNEPPEDLDLFFNQLIRYIEGSYLKSDKDVILSILKGGSCHIDKTGEWGKKWGYSEAGIIIVVDFSKLKLITESIKKNLVVLTNNLLLSTDCGLEITKVDFVPKLDNKAQSVVDELSEIVESNSISQNQIPLPKDLIAKGKEMSEAYLYIYFVENYLRVFIEHVQSKNTIVFPADVLKTISKNKANELQNKYLPLRGNSDLYYCDFVQLQQIISNNWSVFKNYFPQQDQHWLRVKIEDMYRIRNLIAHCGYVTNDDLQLIKNNFRVIIGQLKISS